jgi:hypothetical protein
VTRTLDVLANDDRATGEAREGRNDIANVGAIEIDGYARLLLLRGLLLDRARSGRRASNNGRIGNRFRFGPRRHGARRFSTISFVSGELRARLFGERRCGAERGGAARRTIVCRRLWRRHGGFETSRCHLGIGAECNGLCFPACGRHGWTIYTDVQFAVSAIHRVLARRVEVDDQAHRVDAELRQAKIADRAARLAVVARPAHGQTGRAEIHHQPIRAIEREVTHADVRVQCDHDFGAARGCPDADMRDSARNGRLIGVRDGRRGR